MVRCLIDNFAMYFYCFISNLTHTTRFRNYQYYNPNAGKQAYIHQTIKLNYLKDSVLFYWLLYLNETYLVTRTIDNGRRANKSMKSGFIFSQLHWVSQKVKVISSRLVRQITSLSICRTRPFQKEESLPNLIIMVQLTSKLIKDSIFPYT